MKLYLSSQKLGNYPDKLLKLIGDNKKVVVIANALDDKDLKYRRERVKREFDLLKTIGLIPVELDLRKYFYDSKGLRDFVKDKSLIWIRGGNVFVLRRAMEAANFDKEVLPLIKDGKIAYGGYSAGVIIACKDLWASEIIDDIYSVPSNYPCMITPSKGLGLIDYYLVPHYDSTEEWAINVVKYVDMLKKKKKKYLTLCEGEVYYCDGINEGVILKNGK